MNILITGSNGFLGKIFVSILNKQNCKIETLNRSNSDYNFDLSNEVPLIDKKFDLVIHTAGRAHFKPNSNYEIDIIFRNNLYGTYNLLKSLTGAYIPKYFIFISSVSVYGLSKGTLIDESRPLLASDPYGKSKIEAEKLIINWCNKNNVKYTILRLPLIIGKAPKGNLYDMINAIKKGYYFNIGNGLAKKSMVLATDVGKILITIAPIGGIYNLTDGYHPTVKEFSLFISSKYKYTRIFSIPRILCYIIALIGELLGRKSIYNLKKFKQLTSTLTFDDSKACNTFNWRPNAVLNHIEEI